MSTWHRGARRRRALARRRRAPTGSDQSHEDCANRVKFMGKLHSTPLPDFHDTPLSRLSGKSTKNCFFGTFRKVHQKQCFFLFFELSLSQGQEPVPGSQCVAVCCSALQYDAMCCSVLQCVAVCCSVLQCVTACCSVLQCVAVCCSVLQRVASVLHHDVVCCFVLKHVAVRCSVLQRVTACCSVLHPNPKP